MMWDLTGFPSWTCSLKAGANAYEPISKGSLMEDVVAKAVAGVGSGVGGAGRGLPMPEHLRDVVFRRAARRTRLLDPTRPR